MGIKRKDFEQPVHRPPVQTIHLRNVLDVQQTSVYQGPIRRLLRSPGLKGSA